MYVKRDGDVFNSRINSLGDNHGFIDLAIANRTVEGYVVTPAGKKIDFNSTEFNNILQAFINNRLEELLERGD